jgi:RNA polymerase sigma-70 factor (ECF subfamily)
MSSMGAGSAASLSDLELMEGLRSELAASTGKTREDADSLFTEVFNRYHERVRAWCYRISGDQESAYDLSQEVFIKAYRHLHSFRGDSSLSTWLYAIARNHCLTSLKRRATDDIPLDLASHSMLRDKGAEDPDLAAEQGETWRRLLQFMTRTLDPMEVRVMALHYGHDVPLATITRQLALDNPSGAKAYIVNARRKLQSVIRRRGLSVVLEPARDAEYWRRVRAA